MPNTDREDDSCIALAEKKRNTHCKLTINRPSNGIINIQHTFIPTQDGTTVLQATQTQLANTQKIREGRFAGQRESMPIRGSPSTVTLRRGPACLPSQLWVKLVRTVMSALCDEGGAKALRITSE